MASLAATEGDASSEDAGGDAAATAESAPDQAEVPPQLDAAGEAAAYKQAATKFNIKPKDGIKYLIDKVYYWFDVPP